MAKRIPVSEAARPMEHRRHSRRPALESMERRVLLAQTFTVTNSLDDGSPGTLRAAIIAANASVDVGNTIDFDIPAGDSPIINVTGSGLPAITRAVTIDGFTQPGSSSIAPAIQLDGDDTTSGTSGLTLNGVSGCLIRGLNIRRFNSTSLAAGIKIIGGSNNRIQANFIGINAGGFVSGAGQERNSNGVVIQGRSTGNIIGTDGDGVNDADEGNLISGNTNGDGVEISGAGTTGNRVAGNRIGTDRLGLQPVANRNGVVIDGGASGNFIGTNGDGVSDNLERNIISGSVEDGVSINGGSNNSVSGNFIGTNLIGTSALGNSGDGVVIAQGDGNTLQGNVVSGNNEGVLINSDNNSVSGNFIGTNASGTAALSNTFDGLDLTAPFTGNVIDANVISGNNGHGMVIDGDGNSVSGNQIGTNVTGTAAIPNFGDGVLLRISAENNVIGDNLISGNGFSGVEIRAGATSHNLVAGNRIGTNAAGTAAIPNVNDGVFIQSGAFGNTVGGTTPGSGNVIAFNSKGVVVGSNSADVATVGNSILGNSIFANATIGLDLGNDGPTPNHPTSPTPGPNDFQNYPELTSVAGNTIAGTLDSTPGHTFRLEFFESLQPGPGSQAQGQTFLGSTTVTTDATGKASFTVTLPVAINPGLAVTATATDTTPGATLGDTSEFSIPMADLAVTKVADPTVGTAGQALTYTLTVTNNGTLPATGVIATDAVPAGSVFVATGASQGTASLVDGVVVASLGDLAVGASATVTIIVTPSAAGSLTNTADVTANEPDPDPSNNNATVTTTINPVPPLPAVNLSVTNTAKATGVAGQDLTYTIVVANAGPGNESAAHLLDRLPPGVVLVSTSVPPAAAAAGLLEFDLGGLPAHASRTIVLIVQPMAAGTLVNQAVVSGIEPDLDLSNNVASATTTVTAAPAALAVALAADPSTATVGRELTYTLTVANSGPGPASGVVLTSDVPAGATIVAASQTQGSSSISSGVVTTALGGLAVGASATVTIVVIPTAAGTLTTVARVAGNEPNPKPAGAVAMLSTPVAPEPPTPMADLLVTKTASPDPATVGVPLTYTVTITNLGPDAEPAAGITLVDLLPPGVTFVSSSLAPTSTTPNGLTYALGALAAGASQSVTIVVVPKVPGPLFNQAVATGVGPDPDLSNNYAEVSITAHQAPTVVSLERLGYHAGPTTLSLRFSAPLDPATAVDLHNYRLFEVLKGGRREAIRIKSATYDPSSRTVTLAPAHQLYLFGHYQLAVNGKSPTGVSDVYGNLLDGAGTGRPGSNYVRKFGSEVLVGQSPPAGPRAAKAHAAATKAHAAVAKAHAAATKTHAAAAKAHAAATKTHAAAHAERANAGRRA
jgi:uncharacterized repeat protein (TIGR01451 family)